VRARANEKQATGSPVLAAALRQARVQAGVSQYQLAALAGVSRSAVQAWERARRIPQEENWVQLELALGPLGIVRDSAPQQRGEADGRAA
jgi:DNA-binding transcriptional regulator YiaG